MDSEVTMDQETYNASIESEISNTNDISRLNDIIGEDGWNTSISHLAFHRILQLAGVDNVVEIVTENDTDLTPENRKENDHSGNDEKLPIADEGSMMIGGDNPLSATENVSNSQNFVCKY